MNRKRRAAFSPLLLCLSILTAGAPRAALAQSSKVSGAQSREGVSFDSLKEGGTVEGFRAEAVYLNDSDKPFGARLRHARTGFTLDFLEIQSVPQVFAWVNSFPTSDRGEPHTQEHLLLGKGNKGRAHSGLEGMSLAGSSAFTQQWRTCYHFHTAAGPEVFYKLFESQMDALLHPDYTDEEIRREVSHWGVGENPADKGLRLEEKGTVYQEMATTYDRPISLLFRAESQMLYGAEHPLALSSGGWPSAIRAMKAEDIRKFHSDNYHLANMGMVASFPKGMPLGSVLGRLDAILNKLEPAQSPRRYTSESDMPAPRPAPAGQIKLVEYPHKNEQQPGWVMFAYPAQLKLDTREKTLLNLFLSNVAGDATTNLYKLFVDTKTRVMETGAKGVFAFLDDEMIEGNPVYVGLTDVVPSNMTDEKIASIRQKITDEMKRVASFADGSAELREFNERMRSRVIQTRRTLSKFVNSPPGFGFRNTDSGWMTHLLDLNRTPGFRKSVTLKPELAAVDGLLASDKNAWRDLVARWHLADSVPYAVAAKPSPQLITQGEQERAARSRAQLAEVEKRYGVADEQEALKRFKADYDAETAQLERLAQASASTKFLERPPLTLDDQLDYKVTRLQGGVPLVASNFENMTSATAGLALRLDGVPQDRLVYLSALPQLLTQVGVVKDGKAVAYEQMSEMLRKEILALNSYFSTNFKTGRAELVVRGAGNDAAESRRALEWMKLVLESPDWRVENVARIRDLVDQVLSGMRNRTQGSEENWVNDPANAYWRQDSPLLLSTSSFMTQAHNVHRLRWLLKDAGDAAQRDAISGFLSQLASAATPVPAPNSNPSPADVASLWQRRRQELKNLLAAMQGTKEAASSLGAADAEYFDSFQKLPEGAKTLATEAAKDLDQLLSDVPDESLGRDWDYLVREIRGDLLVPPAQALSELDSVRKGLLKAGGARMFLISSAQTRTALEPGVRDLLSTLEAGQVVPAKYDSTRLIESRVRERLGSKETPVFVGLVNPNTQGGVFLNSAPMATYSDADNKDALLDYLASRLYGGAGAHAIFIKTWGAGLAYSNGLGGSPSLGRLSYYAERTPELPQTLRFVIDELKKAKPDPGLTEYAIAIAFAQFRSASPYESRGEAMAADIADGTPPESVRKFRQGLLNLRDMPNLSDELFKRMNTVYARILPGLGAKAGSVEGGVFYVIGPENQLSAYEQYLKTVEGPDARLYRIYPRDYWLTSNYSVVRSSAP
jgi:Zn-dependent M16 (insulinase) family peptidase